MLVSQELKKAKALIADPKDWTQGVMARNANGRPTKATSPNAVCYCSHGAVRKLHPDENPVTCKMVIYLHRASRNLSNHQYWYLTPFNDNCTHAEVMKAWDLAIEMAEKEEQS